MTFQLNPQGVTTTKQTISTDFTEQIHSTANAFFTELKIFLTGRSDYKIDINYPNTDSAINLPDVLIMPSYVEDNVRLNENGTYT